MKCELRRYEGYLAAKIIFGPKSRPESYPKRSRVPHHEQRDNRVEFTSRKSFPMLGQ